MRRNIYLRLAACLLLAVAASTSLLSGTWTKYTSVATGAESARVAKFSFVAGSQKYDDNDDWYGANTDIDIGPANTYDPLKHYREIAIAAGTPTEFEMPLFDMEYGQITPLFGGLGDALVTVESKTNSDGTRDLVVAPGTGTLFGDPVNNIVNYSEGSNADVGRYFAIDFRNDSDVTVRFKLQVDADASMLHDVPLVISDMHSNAINGKQWTRIDRDPPVVLTCPRQAGPAGAVSAPAPNPPEESDDWVVLEPGDPTYTLIFGLLWLFEDDFIDDDTISVPHIHSFYKWGTEQVYPAVDFDDERDTALGIAGRNYLNLLAAGSTPTTAQYDAAHMKLVFKLEVEQID